MPTLIVAINGTDINPWHRYNLTQNPFPQLGKAEWDEGERRIAALDGDPIKSVDDLRERLMGFSDDFIALCVGHYKPGERTRFKVSFPEEREAVSG